MTKHLSELQLRSRVLAIAAVGLGAVFLRSINPTDAHPWLTTSCGAVTGVPCIFCGMTRALHLLLNGDFSRALYFNWLAFPLAMLVLGIVLVSVCELLLQRKIFRMPVFRLTPRAIALSLVTLVMLWTVQVYLAVSQHKTELLNPRGPLYALLVR